MVWNPVKISDPCSTLIDPHFHGNSTRFLIWMDKFHNSPHLEGIGHVLYFNCLLLGHPRVTLARVVPGLTPRYI